MGGAGAARSLSLSACNSALNESVPNASPVRGLPASIRAIVVAWLMPDFHGSVMFQGSSRFLSSAIVESLVVAEVAGFKNLESSSCLTVDRERGSGKAPKAKVEVELVDDKIVVVVEAPALSKEPTTIPAVVS